MEKGNVELKEYIEFLRNINETLRYDIINIRNQANNCETNVLRKK